MGEGESSGVKSGIEKIGRGIEVAGFKIEGLSIGGHETCIIIPSLRLAFDIGRCPQRAVSQNFIFISHAHMDHIGGLPIYVATRGLYNMKPPSVIVPSSIKQHVEKLFEVHRAMDHSELMVNIVGLNPGEEFFMRKDLKVKPFRTYHTIPSQGYVVYSIRHKLKEEYIGLGGKDIVALKHAGIEVTHTLISPEIAFTGDTMSDFIFDISNTDVLNARILIMESTFIDDCTSIQDARAYGHMHLLEIIDNAHWFKNKAILLIHFSARYDHREIKAALASLPPILEERVHALTEGFF